MNSVIEDKAFASDCNQLKKFISIIINWFNFRPRQMPCPLSPNSQYNNKQTSQFKRYFYLT